MSDRRSHTAQATRRTSASSVESRADTARAAGVVAPQAPKSRGFTLIEILIVVVVLGILASIVLPQFSNASETAKENTLKDELRYLRMQTVVYKAQHGDIAPGPTAADFLAQMTMHTNEAGGTSATPSAVFKYGPYLSRVPKNPINSLETLEISSDDPLVGDGSHGWEYNPATQAIIADIDGTDSSNVTRYDKY
jgi:general secretion pathway protein G